MDLENSFQCYVDLVQARCHNITEKSNIPSTYRIHVNIGKEVEQLEKTEQFKQLVSESKTEFFPDKKTNWRRPRFAENFFRRSGCYNTIFEGKQVDTNKLFELFEQSLKRKNYNVGVFVPLELVYLDLREYDFERFRIRRYSKDELDILLNQAINKNFYPYSVVDTYLLSQYWFICIEEEYIIEDELNVNWDEVGKARFRSIDFDEKKIEFALKTLSLYKWGDGDFFDFITPFVLRTNNDLLSSPLALRFEEYKLNRRPDFHPETGEELNYEIPEIFHYVSGVKETQIFSEFISRIEKILIIIEQKSKSLYFLDLALNYFLKAFFSDDFEKLLWNISAIEALLGGKGEGLLERLRRRSALIVGETIQSRLDIKRTFNELYDFRSRLVHASPFTGKKNKPINVYQNHLFKAHDISRDIILWFLGYIEENQDRIADDIKIEKSNDIPDIQKEVCELIDFNPENITYYSFRKMKDNI